MLRLRTPIPAAATGDALSAGALRHAT
jgi:hypothetical protein